MTTLKIETKQGEATSTYITVEQIVGADFYAEGSTLTELTPWFT